MVRAVAPKQNRKTANRRSRFSFFIFHFSRSVLTIPVRNIGLYFVYIWNKDFGKRWTNISIVDGGLSGISSNLYLALRLGLRRRRI